MSPSLSTVDYVISVGEYPFLSGLPDTCHNITILDDKLAEPVETFRMEVIHQDEQLDSIEISTSSAVVHIIDNDSELRCYKPKDPKWKGSISRKYKLYLIPGFSLNQSFQM